MRLHPILFLGLLCPLLSAQITSRRIAAGLNRPLWAGAPDGDERVFIAEKGGRIKILANGQVRSTPFLDLSAQVSNLDEQGLLGVAFHPSYRSNGRFFVDYTDLNGNTVVSRFTVSADPNVADAASESVILTQTQPFANHNGGDLHFGPDGYLYIFFGDGGSADDPGCRAQKLTTILGKVVRIDVDSATPYAIPPTNPFFGQSGVRQEIFHYGLRNPWRNGFDRLTGDLFIGDVGQNANEEIDVAPAGSAGLNFGWKVMEGTRCNQSTNCLTGTPPCNDPAFVPALTELLHVNGSFAIIGGRVYRGCACPSEFGTYFYADFADDKIRSFVYDRSTGTISNLADRTAEFAPGGGLNIRNIASFGEDGFGELLIVDHTTGTTAGEVYKMVPASAVQSSSVVRNGLGGNRLCLAGTSLPILGNVWEARVDARSHAGARLSALFGYSAPSGGTFLGRNEILVDTASALRFQLVRASTGGIDVFRAAIPCNTALVGMTFYVQAAIVSNRIELCNALDVTTGYY